MTWKWGAKGGDAGGLQGYWTEGWTGRVPCSPHIPPALPGSGSLVGSLIMAQPLSRADELVTNGVAHSYCSFFYRSDTRESSS